MEESGFFVNISIPFVRPGRWIRRFLILVLRTSATNSLGMPLENASEITPVFHGSLEAYF
jgi:hypothetical protein